MSKKVLNDAALVALPPPKEASTNVMTMQVLGPQNNASNQELIVCNDAQEIAQLKQVREDILTMHEHVTVLGVKSYTIAVMIGQKLSEAKALLGHGSFRHWLKRHFINPNLLSQSTIDRYMRLAKGKAKLIDKLAAQFSEDDHSSPPDLVRAEATLRLMNLTDALELLRDTQDKESKAKSAVKKSAKSSAKAKEPMQSAVLDGLFSSESPEYLTPLDIVNTVEAFFNGIDLDPCAESLEEPNIPASMHYTAAMDSLDPNNPWRGRVYINPPYGNAIEAFIDRTLAEFICGHIDEAILLVPARTDTQWMQTLNDFPRIYIRGRLQFRRAEAPTESAGSAPFPSALIFVGPVSRWAIFQEHFAALGEMFIPHRAIASKPYYQELLNDRQ